MPFKKLPQHIAIIMDGNGRWANQRHLPRMMGHKKGADTVRMVVRTCAEIGVPYLTLYAFSQENWKRPQPEIDFLMNLLDHFLDSELKSLKKEGVRFLTIGRVNDLSPTIQKKINTMKEATKDNQKLNLIVALNYGSRQEIMEATKTLIAEAIATNGSRDKWLEELNEKKFEQHLNTAGIPDPDLLIRTSGEMRLSNFLLWQCSYSELHVSPKCWPDFGKEDLWVAVRDYGERHRRFGAIA